MNTDARLGLARPEYASLALYQPDRSTVRIDLSDNTNRWGMPPAAARVLREAGAASFTRYPDPYAGSLKEALASYCGVQPAQLVTGCGSDDVLDSAIRALGRPGELLAASEPTFVMVPTLATVNRMEYAPLPFRGDFDIDVGGLLATGARIFYVCSPNNPTGTTARTDSIARLADAAPGLVIVDEAYIEFTDSPGCVELARTRSNVLVIRTLSKAFGLAGLRVGYGVGAPAIVREVEKSRGPFKVSALAALAAGAALREDVSWMRLHARLAREARSTLTLQLEARGIHVHSSAANFVLARIHDAAAIAARLRAAGVAVRAFPRLPGGGDALRITVGPPEEMSAFLAAFDAARAACA